MSLINLTTKQLIKQFPRNVQSQSMLNPVDKFPDTNENFSAGLQEWVAVILGIKPMCDTKTPTVLINYTDRFYNFKQICNLLKMYSNKKFYMVPYAYENGDFEGGTVIFFEHKNIKKAMLQYYMRNAPPILFPNKKNLSDFHIINGKLLGYLKDNIFGWHLEQKLDKHLKLDPSDNDWEIESLRNSIITNPKAIQFKKKYSHEFNKQYNSAINKIPKLIKKSLKMEKIEQHFKKYMVHLSPELMCRLFG